MEIFLASNNRHKAEEFNRIFKNTKIVLPSEKGINFHFPENGKNYLENSMGKAIELFKQTGRPVIADDSGLSVSALNGAPGIYSARYGSKTDTNLSDPERNKLLLKELENTANRKAFFVCCIVFLINEYRFYISQETVSGVITKKPSGNNGFGYDPIFYIPELKKTAADLFPEEKDLISHRGKAGQKLIPIIQEYLAEK